MRFRKQKEGRALTTLTPEKNATRRGTGRELAARHPSGIAFINTKLEWKNSNEAVFSLNKNLVPKKNWMGTCVH